VLELFDEFVVVDQVRANSCESEQCASFFPCVLVKEVDIRGDDLY
jgi:hypothetical protein